MSAENERERIIEACQRLTGMTPIGWQLDLLVALASTEPQLVFMVGGRQAGRSAVLRMANALEEAHELQLEPASPVTDDRLMRAAARREEWFDGLMTPDEVRAIREDLDRRVTETLSRPFFGVEGLGLTPRIDDATQCKATTFESRRCLRRRVPGSDYCKQHGARHQRKVDAAGNDEPPVYVIPCADGAHMHLTRDRRLRGYRVLHCIGEREATADDCGVQFT